jgi:hypothetical protein
MCWGRAQDGQPELEHALLIFIQLGFDLPENRGSILESFLRLRNRIAALFSVPFAASVAARRVASAARVGRRVGRRHAGGPGMRIHQQFDNPPPRRDERPGRRRHPLVGLDTGIHTWTAPGEPKAALVRLRSTRETTSNSPAARSRSPAASAAVASARRGASSRVFGNRRGRIPSPPAAAGWRRAR